MSMLGVMILIAVGLWVCQSFSVLMWMRNMQKWQARQDQAITSIYDHLIEMIANELGMTSEELRKRYDESKRIRPRPR